MESIVFKMSFLCSVEENKNHADLKLKNIKLGYMGPCNANLSLLCSVRLVHLCVLCRIITYISHVYVDLTYSPK